MKIFKDPIWQFIGVVISIIAIFVALYISSTERPSKKLRVEVLSNNPLISVNTDVVKEIEIFYKNAPVQTLSLILLRLENTGNEPIAQSDYSEPIRIILSENAEVGEATIQETQPSGIKLTASKIASNQIELAKTLLNPGDQVVIKILAINNDDTLNITARIAGIQNVEVVSVLDSQTASKSSGNFFLFLFGGFGLLILWAMIWNSKSVVDWRIKNYGYNPALEAYATAQERASTKLMDSENMRLVISYLRTAFIWDIAYFEKAKNDPIFSKLQSYEIYKAFISEFENIKNGEKESKGS
ncbi:MAG: hypothetical protein JNM55_10550 [Anaerolineales bacterium]|nr:hypothetical protein [Anaerolineales bacterium]